MITKTCLSLFRMLGAVFYTCLLQSFMMRSKKTVECPHCTLQNWHSIFLNYNFVISSKRVKISSVNSLQEGNIIFPVPRLSSSVAVLFTLSLTQAEYLSNERKQRNTKVLLSEMRN